MQDALRFILGVQSVTKKSTAILCLVLFAVGALTSWLYHYHLEKNKIRKPVQFLLLFTMKMPAQT